MNIDEIIQKYVPRARQTRLLILTSLEWMLVAAGVMVLSLTLPSVIRSFNAGDALQGAMASAVFFGMLIGALTSGLISDLMGRKWTNIFLMLVAGVFSGLTALSTSPLQFALFRFLSGLGYGGLLPVVNAYLTEFTAIRIRGVFLTLQEASWALGSIAVGLFTILTVDSLGWRWSYGFLMLWSLPLIVITLMLPESPKFAFFKKGKNALEKILGSRIEEDIEAKPRVKMPVGALFTKRFLTRTIMIWASWFSVSFVYYGLFVWAPRIFESKGLTAASSLRYTFFMLLMQLPGYLLATLMIETVGRKKSLAFFFIGTGISAIIMSAVTTQPALIAASVLISLFCMGTWAMVYAYTPELYPTEMRALGNGTSGMMARIAGIIAPYITGFLMSITGNVLFVMTVMAILCGASAILVSRYAVETKGTAIE